MAKNETYRKLITSTQWLRLRKETLTRTPLCSRCFADGRLVSATEVHHIVPCEYALTQRAMERLMFDPGNLVALCHDCHVQAHVELGRSGKAAVKRINEAQLDAVKKRFFDDPGRSF